MTTRTPTESNVDDRPGTRPLVEVRTYIVSSDGRLEELSCYPLEAYGSCPQVGDAILTRDYIQGGTTAYHVEKRYFVEEGSRYTGWALILQEIDSTGEPRQLWEEWNEATEFWDKVAEEETERFDQALLRETLKGPTPKKPPGGTKRTR